MKTQESIIKYVDILLSNGLNSLIIQGPAGIGKSKTVLDTITNKWGLIEGQHYLYFSGYTTPLALFNNISKSRTLEKPMLVLLDDMDGILTNKTSIAILKAALSDAGKRMVSYESSTKNPDGRQFAFEGKVILIVNDVINNKSIAPLIDRSIYYNIENNADELSEYIEQNLATMYPKFTDEERESIWSKVKRFTNSPGFSIRSTNRAFAFYKANKEEWYELFLRSLRK